MTRAALRSILKLAVSLALLVVLLGALLIGRLSMGPITLDAYAGALETRINDALDGWRVSVTGAELALDAEGDPSLRLRRVRLTDPSGVEVVRAPLAAVTIDMGAAIRGRFALTGAELVGPSALILRDADGVVRLALGDAAATAAPSPTSVPSVPSAPSAPSDQSDQRDPGATVSVSADETATTVADIVEGLSGDQGSVPALERFRSIRVRDARLRYVDRVSRTVWRSEDATLTIARTDTGVSARVSAAARRAVEGRDAGAEAEAGGPPVTISVTGARARGAEFVVLGVRVRDLPSRAVAEQIRAFEMASRFEGTLSGDGAARLRLADGRLISLAGEIRVVDGLVPLGPTVAPIRARSVAARFGYARASDEVRLESLDFDFGDVSGGAFGRLTLERDADGRTIGATGDLALENVRIARRDLYAEPVTVASASADLTIATEPLRLTAANLALVKEDLTARGDLSVTVEPDGRTSGRAAATLEPFSAERLAPLWPKPAAPDARAWVAENVLGGRITGAELALAWSNARLKAADAAPSDIAPSDTAPSDAGPSDAGPSDAAPPPAGAATGGSANTAAAAGAPEVSVDFVFGFEALSMTAVKQMAPLTEGVGRGRVTAERFTADLDSGVVDLGADGRLTLSESRFVIPDFSVDVERGDVDLNASGPARALLALIDQEPLGFPSRFGLDVDGVRGRATASAQLSLPLLKALPLEDVSVSVDVSARDLSLEPPDLGQRVSAAQARISADKTRLRFDSPRVLYAGTPVAVRWTEIFSPAPGRARSVYALGARLGAAKLRELGAPAWLSLSGAAVVDATLTLVDRQAPSLSLSADLTPLGARLDPIGFAKSPGAPGSLSAEARLGAREIRLSGVKATLDALSLEADAVFAADGALETAEIARLAIGPGTSLSGRAERSAERGVALSLAGPRVDLRPVIDRLETAGGADADGGAGAGGGADGPADDFSLSLRAERARLDDSRSLRALAADLEIRGAETRLDASAETRGGAPVSLSYEDSPSLPEPDKGAALKIESADAGRLLSDLELTGQASGGALSVGARVRESGRATGAVRISDVTLIDAPVLAQILSNASILGLIDGDGADGIRFTRVRVPFDWRGGRIEIDEAAATGPSMGVTADGVIDRRARTIDLAGSVSPFYAVNSLLGRVPVLGDLFTGGRGQGIVGVAYSVNGPIADPRVTVNPLSALAPGPLRALFEGEGERPEISPGLRGR